MVFNYFITDSNGYAFVPFEVSSSYHVLWKTTQSYEYDSDDGPIKTTTFEPPNPTHPAYIDTSYPLGTVEIIGEWERKPVGGIYLPPHPYSCEFVLTEESFHGSGGAHAGNWAAAMGANISFEIESINVIPEFPLGTIMGVFSSFISLFFWRKLK